MTLLNQPRKNLPAPKDIIPRAFPGIPQLEIDELVSRSQVVDYPAGAVLCREGQLESKFYILLHGRVDVTKTVNNTEERRLKSLESGDFFGEMAIIHNAPRAATVTASTPVTVLEIDRENFDLVIRGSSTISLAMVREISRRLRENDQMAVEDLQMRASELARREFVTNVAHELRTPLMAAGGFLQLLQKGMVTADKLPAAIDTISRNIQQITTLVNDILFLQEMDLILPKFQPVDMTIIASEVAERYRATAAASGLEIQVDIARNLPNVSGDPKSLERALMALVDNAIKFSRDGGVVGISLSEENTYVVINIEDHGIGIPEENLPRVFDRFYHMEKSGDNLYGGIGLGLAITNQVIKQHNGRLSVQSQPGLGTTFTVRLKSMRVIF